MAWSLQCQDRWRVTVGRVISGQARRASSRTTAIRYHPGFIRDLIGRLAGGRRIIYSGIAALLLVGGWLSFWLCRFTVDDAFISWRYGHSLSEVGEWNWNPVGSPRVEAYTNPLYTFVSIVPAALGYGLARHLRSAADDSRTRLTQTASVLASRPNCGFHPPIRRNDLLQGHHFHSFRTHNHHHRLTATPVPGPGQTKTPPLRTYYQTHAKPEWSLKSLCSIIPQAFRICGRHRRRPGIGPGPLTAVWVETGAGPDHTGHASPLGPGHR